MHKICNSCPTAPLLRHCIVTVGGGRYLRLLLAFQLAVCPLQDRQGVPKILLGSSISHCLLHLSSCLLGRRISRCRLAHLLSPPLYLLSLLLYSLHTYHLFSSAVACIAYILVCLLVMTKSPLAIFNQASLYYLHHKQGCITVLLRRYLRQML